MADNDAFRYLGGLACTNLSSVHMRMGVYDPSIWDPNWWTSGYLGVPGGLFCAFLRCTNETSKIFKKPYTKIMVLAI